MRRVGVAALIGVLACAAIPGAACSATSTAADTAAGPVIQTEDVDRFYKLYDAAGGHPTADQLQHDYLDPGSEGLHHLAKVRNVTGARIAEAMVKHPEIYSDARQCMVVLPRVRQRLEVALRNWGVCIRRRASRRSRSLWAGGNPWAWGAPTRACRSASRRCAQPPGSIPTSRSGLCT